MSVKQQLKKRIAPLTASVAIPAAATTVSLIALYGNSASHEALLYLNRGNVVRLSDFPGLKSLSFEQRKAKIETLKTRVFGFSDADTKRIYESLDGLLNIHDASMWEVLDNLPDDLTIEYAGRQDCSGSFDIELNKVFITQDCLGGSDLWLSGTLSHEFCHAKQDAMGFLKVEPIYTDTKTVAAFVLIAEAEARSFEMHAVMRLLLKNKKLVSGEKLFELEPANDLEWYLLAYGKAYYAVEKRGSQLTLAQKEAEAGLMARGAYIKYLLSNNNRAWSEDYLERIQKRLRKKFGFWRALPAKEDARLKNYVWGYLQRTYGLSNRQVDEALEKIWATPRGQELKMFQRQENSWTGYTQNAVGLFKMKLKRNKTPQSKESLKVTFQEPQKRFMSIPERIWNVRH